MPERRPDGMAVFVKYGRSAVYLQSSVIPALSLVYVVAETLKAKTGPPIAFVPTAKPLLFGERVQWVMEISTLPVHSSGECFTAWLSRSETWPPRRTSLALCAESGRSVAKDGPKRYLRRLSNELKKSSPSTEEVICLRCDRKFQSEDKLTNRICSKCKRTNDWQEGAVNDHDLYLGRRRAMPDTSKDRTSDSYQAWLAKMRKQNASQKGKTFLGTKNALRLRAEMKKRKAKA